MEQEWQEWRCPVCNQLLGKHRLAEGSQVQVKCHRCGTLNAIAAQAPIRYQDQNVSGQAAVRT